MLRCYDCKKPIVEDIKYMDWLSLMNYFEHEYEEGEISQATYEHMIDRLATFKSYALDLDDVKQEVKNNALGNKIVDELLKDQLINCSNPKGSIKAREVVLNVLNEDLGG
jgi:hypothetical protein